MNLFIRLFFCAIPVLFLGFIYQPAAIPPRQLLSEYGFFTGKISELKPTERVFYYEVNAPLFTDYAEKSRFIFMPDGAKMKEQEKTAFTFPEGAVIIKNFSYPDESGKAEAPNKVLETRLLIKEKDNWKALTYIWKADQSDAVLEVAGAALPVAWTDKTGEKHQFDYTVPNVNQCKGCHSYDGGFTPIGINTRQLNRTVGGKNQLLDMASKGILELPAGFSPEKAPALTDYRTDHTHIEAAARSYLDGNCAHCHNPHGPASTSGMFLDIDESDPERLGVGKPPVAAGRGSGKRKYGIVPGKPDQSILVYRIESNDPGIRMPELGRQLAHKEGVELIRAWIKNMK